MKLNCMIVLVACIAAHVPSARAEKKLNNFVSELMRKHADLGVGDLTSIYLSYDGRQGGIPNVIQPGLNLQAISRC